MEWKSLSILAVICQLAVPVHGADSIGGTPSLSTEGKKARRAAVVLCHPDQTFFCVNLTHYSTCVHLDLSDLLNISFAMSRGGEYNCGVERCCQAGAASPCTYRCQRQSLDFENPRIPWNFPRLQKKKKRIRSKTPLTSEEVDRLNRIVSVKSFIIRQKDLEESYEDDLDSDENTFKWKPSYRTHCKIKRSSSIHMETTPCLQITTVIPRDELNRTNQLTTSTTTLTTTRKSTTKTTTFRTTTTKTTKTRTTTTKTTKTRTTKRKRTTRQRVATTKTPRKRPVKPRLSKRPKTTTKPRFGLDCRPSMRNQKAKLERSCEDYLQCIKEQGKYKWKIRKCPAKKYFEEKDQKCKDRERVSCVII